MKKRILIMMTVVAVIASHCGFSPVRAAQTPPSYYSSKDLGYTSGVDSQGSSRVCWAFAHNELLEINLAKKYGVKYDFSEEAMKFETSYVTEPTYGFQRMPNGGGNEYISTAYLARTGSVLEKDEPFGANTDERTADGRSLPRVGRLMSVPMYSGLPNRNGSLDRGSVDNIKSLIMEYGAVGASIYFDQSLTYQTSRRHSYNYDGPSLCSNHILTLIGWDDSFPASEFAHKPAGDGAFIAKNSYGLYHDNETSDCVYISYYDKFVCTEYFACDYETDTSLYDNVYQYDYMGWVQNVELAGGTLTAVSRFVARSPGEKLTAVSTYIAEPGTTVEVLVCTGGDLRDERSYRSVAEKTFGSCGYFVIPVRETVIPAYEYRVALRISAPGDKACFPIHCNSAAGGPDSENIVNCAAALSNTCFIGKSFSALTPIERALGDDSAMLCIKAFTKKPESAVLPPSVFNDVKPGSWYEQAVSYAAGAGLFSGTDKTTFSPQTVMTRAMFVRVLANLSGVDFSEYGGYTGYKDVPRGRWYSAAVLWASEKGIVNGTTPNTFEPDKPVSRQQMCVMLLRYAERALGYKLEGAGGGFEFSDGAQIQEYARAAVYVCRKYGFINGVTPTEFSPRAGATRAQVATLFRNFCTRILF